MSEIFARRLKEIIDSRNIQQKSIAATLGVSPAVFSAWVKCKSEPSFDMLSQLCDTLEVSSDYLLGLSDAQTTIEKPKKSKLGSLLDATIQRDPFADLTPEQRTVIESSLAAFRDANDAAASRQDA